MLGSQTRGHDPYALGKASFWMRLPGVLDFCNQASLRMPQHRPMSLLRLPRPPQLETE
jgi:hypothetical protein